MSVTLSLSSFQKISDSIPQDCPGDASPSYLKSRGNTIRIVAVVVVDAARVDIAGVVRVARRTKPHIVVVGTVFRLTVRQFNEMPRLMPQNSVAAVSRIRMSSFSVALIWSFSLS